MNTKRFLKALTALVLAVCMLLPLAACSTSGTTVMSYGRSKITSNMYKYWLCRYKAMLLQTYGDIKDTDAFWYSEVSGGVTYNALFTSVIMRNVQTTLVAGELFDQYGLEIPKETLDKIDAYIADLIKEQANGSKSAFNQIASAYGVNAKILREIYIAEEKVNALYDYFYGDNGTETITDSDRQSFLEKNYTHFMHLYVNNVYYYEKDENGNYITDSDGNAKVSALTGDALAEKNAHIEEIDAAMEADGDSFDFDAYYDKYSDDKFYPDGYYMTTQSQFIAEVLSAAFTTEVGKVAKVKSDYGVHYIKRLPIEEKAWEKESYADFFQDYDNTVGQYLYQQLIDADAVNVTLNEAELASITIADVKANYNF